MYTAMHGSQVHRPGAFLCDKAGPSGRVVPRQIRVRATQEDKSSAKGQEWLQKLLQRFQPVKDRSNNPAVLDFEKPLIELEKTIEEVREVAEANEVDVTEQIKELEERAEQLRRKTFARLTPHQRLQVARHPNRPTCLDIILSISDKFVELHGDRAGMDDPAIVCGVGSLHGRTVMLIGHQKGRNTKENVERNFGMPQPNGYRKALRFMKHANKFGFPIVTFIDTPGAYPGVEAEEKGQGEAIAKNLMEMFGLRVPILTVVIGEGGSGGALAIGCGNKMYMLEHSVYYVASPEACAAILWKKSSASPEAAQALKITSNDLTVLGVVDDIIPEPLGGAHQDPKGTFPAITQAIKDFLDEYEGMTEEEIMQDRYAKYRRLGVFDEYSVPAGLWEQMRQDRALASGVKTASGQWAFDDAEKEYLEELTNQEMEWNKVLAEKGSWVKPPSSTPWSLKVQDGPSSKVPPRQLSQPMFEDDPDQEESSNGATNGANLSNGSSNGIYTFDKMETESLKD